MTSRPLRFLLQSDRKLRAAAAILKAGKALSVDWQTYILSQGIDLEAFEARFAT
jgi:hypothetical protein